MNQIYNNLSLEDQEAIDLTYRFVYRGKGKPNMFRFLPKENQTLNCFFDVFHFATLTELLEIFQTTLFPFVQKQSKLYVNTCDSKKRQHILKNSIVHPRNQSAHHNLLFVYENDHKQKISNKTLNHFVEFINLDITDEFKSLLQRNRLHFNLLFNLYTCYSLLTQHGSQKSRAKHLFKSIQKHNTNILNECSNLTLVDSWVRDFSIFFKDYMTIIDKMLENL